MPQPSRSTLSWDLALALHALHGPPFEPLAQAPVWAFTYKSVFLTALATAKRHSELHPFSYKIQHHGDWSSITLQSNPLFVAKMEKAGRPETRLQEVHLQALACSWVLTCLLMPTTVCLGCSRFTWPGCETSFKGWKRLFIPYKPSNSEKIKPATISSWIVKTIWYMYDHCPEDSAWLFKAKAHDLRALATSWNALQKASLPDILCAAQWCSCYTFTSFYPTDLSVVEEDLLKIGPGGHRTARLQCCLSFDTALSTVDYPLWHGLVFAWTKSPRLGTSWTYPDCFIHDLAHQRHLGLHLVINECLFLPLWACLRCISIPSALSHMCPLGLTASAVLQLFFDPVDCGYHASFLPTEPTSSRTDSVS